MYALISAKSRLKIWPVYLNLLVAAAAVCSKAMIFFIIRMNLFLWILLMCKVWRLTHKLSKAQRALCKVCE